MRDSRSTIRDSRFTIFTIRDSGPAIISDEGSQHGDAPYFSDLLEQNGRQLLERLLAVCSYRDRAALRVWLSGEESFSRIAPYIGAGSLPISDQRREVKRFKDRIRRTAKRLGLRASVRLLFHG
jgi:hypothetical protein